MNFPQRLLKTISNKLSLKTVLFDKEKSFLKNLIIQRNLLKKNNRKKNPIKLSNSNNNVIVTNIINISFLKSNTNFHVSDVKGNIKLFISAGFAGFKGKQKKQRRLVITKLVALLIKKNPFLLTKPVALHLNNVNFYKNFIVSKFKDILYLPIIKTFNQIPYNGCRKKKLRRKKHTKKIK